MQGAVSASPDSSHASAAIKATIVVAAFGLLGTLAIMQWTARIVRKQATIASRHLFPAALNTLQATIAFQRMNSEYSDAVVMQEKGALDTARQEAAVTVSSLASAAASVEYDAERHEQAISLMRQVGDLQIRANALYAAAAAGKGIQPKRGDLANLSHENKRIESALEALHRSLDSDFEAGLGLIDRLLRIQAVFEATLLAGMAISLFFSTRALIAAIARRRGDQLLQRAHRENEVLLNSVPSLLIGMDADGHIRHWNSAASSILGWDETSIRGKKLEECGIKWITPDIGSRIEAHIRDPHSDSLDGIALQREGTTRFLGLHAIQFHTDGTPGILVVGADITKRLGAEKSVNLLRLLMDQSHDTIEVIDPDTLGFLDFNERACLDSGYSREELLSMSVLDINPFFDEAVRNRIGEQLEKTGSAILQSLHRRRDGSTFPVEVSVKRVQMDRVYWLAVVRDITDRQRLLQSQKLESIGQLAAGIAHEINTPTQYIGDNVRFLKDAFGEMKILLANYNRLLQAARNNTVSPEMVQNIAVVVENPDIDYLLEEIPSAVEQSLEGVERVAKLVGAMKDFSHPGTKDKVLLDLNRAIESTITVARNEWKYIADLETDYAPDLPMVSCLPGEFNQVILNLIVNAAHAIAEVVKKGGPEKGKIKVQTRHCEEWVEVRIQDTGPGIPEDVQARIFDPFFTTKEIGKGTGQGLAIARSVVVDKHGGGIHFETEAGKGTTFIVRLPCDEKALAALAGLP